MGGPPIVETQGTWTVIGPSFWEFVLTRTPPALCSTATYEARYLVGMHGLNKSKWCLRLSCLYRRDFDLTGFQDLA